MKNGISRIEVLLFVSGLKRIRKERGIEIRD